MKTEVRRLFISDLPEGLGDEDLTSKFNYYGNVTSVEVKQRKDVSSKNATNRFAYINIEIDHSSLQQCLEEFTKKKWKGYYVSVQLAKESFLDRLKREREEANQVKSPVDINHISAQAATEVKINGISSGGKVKKFDDANLESGEEEESVPKVKKRKIVINDVQDDSNEESEEEQIHDNSKIDEDFSGVYNDVVVKNNRNKRLTNKIESVGKEPILKIEKKKLKSLDPSRTQADQKRLKSMVQMKRGYEHQKLAIKSALSKIDVQSKNKIIFDDDDGEMVNGEAQDDEGADKSKKALFDDDESGEDDINFEVKKQFEGKKGQKLMELQSRYKSDQRFQMDERFLEEEENEEAEENVYDDNSEGVDDKVTQEEKRKQLEILEEVLGKKITKAPIHQVEGNKVRKSMLRFDPDQPEHSKYEVRNESSSKSEKKKKKRKDAETEEAKEELPEVSKETFYEVKDAFKPTTEEKEGGFSLLSMFGRKTDGEDAEVEEALEEKATDLPKKKKKFDSQNPFKYDSSDDERDDKPVTEIQKIKTPKEQTSQSINLGAKKLWTEPFFFTNDDYRFQEGMDFMRRIKGEQNPEFDKLRRDLKVLARAKVKRNQRKNKPFQKKLGGAKVNKFKKFKKFKNQPKKR